MVGMLVNLKAALAAPVALFFAALNVGSIQLPIMLKLDSSLAGVCRAPWCCCPPGAGRPAAADEEGQMSGDFSCSGWPGCSPPPHPFSSA